MLKLRCVFVNACVFAIGFLVFVPLANGQQNPARLEVYGGYSMLHPNLPTNIKGSDPSAEKFGEFILGELVGWNTGATVRLTKHFGVTGDFSGYSKSIDIVLEGSHIQANLDLKGFLVGPRIDLGKSTKAKPFVQFLFGTGRIVASASIDSDSQTVASNGFGAAVGGGLDLPLNSSIAVRAIQLDYFPVREKLTGSLTFSNFRWQTGIVLKLVKGK